MRHFRSALPVLAIASLTGCATIVSGTSQRVTVSTMPEGAACRVSQGGMPIGFVASTPGTVRVEKSSNAIEVNCAKPGYGTAQQMQASGVTAWIAGNLVIGGVIGLVVDFATGAAYHYGPDMMLALQTGPVGAPIAQGLPTELTGEPAFAQSHDLTPTMAMATSPDPSPASTSVRQRQAYDAARFRAATGQNLPATHGLIRLPPATPGGDYTVIWPTQSSAD